MNPAPSTFIRDGILSRQQTSAVTSYSSDHQVLLHVVTLNFKNDNVNQWGNLELQKHPSKAVPILNQGPGEVSQEEFYISFTLFNDPFICLLDEAYVMQQRGAKCQELRTLPTFTWTVFFVAHSGSLVILTPSYASF